MASAIIVAAGKGLRMNHTVRKQYLMLVDRPVLSHTLQVFDACDDVEKIYLVVPETDVDFCRAEILPHEGLITRVALVSGGKERQDSVYNGLCAFNAHKGDIVVIHDGVRPFIQQKQLIACINGAKDTGACILGIPISDTLKQLDKAGYIQNTVNRGDIWQAQTPQAFEFDLIMKAHHHARQEGFRGTDDALLVERLGKRVKVIKGSEKNIKITTREDLLLARAIFRTQKQ